MTTSHAKCAASGTRSVFLDDACGGTAAIVKVQRERSAPPTRRTAVGKPPDAAASPSKSGVSPLAGAFPFFVGAADWECPTVIV
jgi:hypothetical protein